MKLICSILIFAGVLALNDASISYEDEMRLFKDQMMVEDLKRTEINRDANSLQCSQTLLAELTKILDTYNGQLETCNKTKEDTIQALNEAAKKSIAGFSESLQGTCDSLTNCAAHDLPIDSLNCYEGESSQSAKTLTVVANDASLQKIELQKNIERAVGDEDVCKTLAMGEYSKSSEKANTNFSNCVSGKSDGGEKPEPTKPAEVEDATTEAPEEGSGEQGEPEGRARRPNSGNKYGRF